MTITEVSDGILLSWSYPRRGNIAIAYFTVDYCYDEQWRRLSKTELKPTETYFQGDLIFSSSLFCRKLSLVIIFFSCYQITNTDLGFFLCVFWLWLWWSFGSVFPVKNLNPGKTYLFRVNSHTLTSQASSEKVSYIIQRKIKDKAITAGIVGGILFFIVAIILAVCTVKCVNKRNKRRRREQENGINNH